MERLNMAKILFKFLILLRKVFIITVITLFGIVIISLFKFIELIQQIIKIYKIYPLFIEGFVILIFIIPLVSIIIEMGYKKALEKDKH